MIAEPTQARVPIRLTTERWLHMSTGHPALADKRDRILETLRAPTLIQAGDKDELLTIRFYEHTPLTSKHLVGAYREISAVVGFVLTAYFMRRPSTRSVTV